MAWTTEQTWYPGNMANQTIFNAQVRDNLNEVYQRLRFVYKSADESVNNSTALQNDDHLYLALGANETWEFRFVLIIGHSGPAAQPDFKFIFTAPAGASGSSQMGGVAEYGTAAVVATDTPAYYLVGTDLVVDLVTAERKIIVVQGYVANGATPGNLQLQWAQALAVAVDLTVYQGSYLLARRVA